MNIYAEDGHKVRFLGKNGFDSELKRALEILTVGEVLTVRFTDVGSWCTSVNFHEYPGKMFNSVMFEDVVEG